MRRFKVFHSLIIGLVFMISSAQGAQIEQIKTHVFKFYLAPALVPDMDFAKTALTKYVRDMNSVLAKNTNRELLFDPNTGIVLTDTKPHSDHAGYLPQEGYEIWAHAVVSDYVLSYGGYYGINDSGEAVLAGLKWLQIYDPDQLVGGTDAMRDYWIQIDHMLHEFAHIYGAGQSEYYGLAMVDDTTGVEPVLDIRLRDPEDSYWSVRSYYFTDPLLQNIYNNALAGYPTDLLSLLETVRFSDLTAAIIREGYRPPFHPIPMPDMNNIELRVYNSVSLTPIKNAKVKIWNVVSAIPYDTQLLHDTKTGNAGDLVFSWGGQGTYHSNYNHLRLIKVDKGGYYPTAQYVSKYDAEEVMFLDNQTRFTINIFLERM